MAKQLKREYKMTKHRKEFKQFKIVQGKKNHHTEMKEYREYLIIQNKEQGNIDLKDTIK